MTPEEIIEPLKLHAPQWASNALKCQNEANACQTQADLLSHSDDQLANEYRKIASQYLTLAKNYKRAADRAPQLALKIQSQEKQVIEHLNLLQLEMQRCNDPRCFNEACQNILYLINIYSLMFLKPYSDYWHRCGGQSNN